jgi:hypothetical protein
MGMVERIEARSHAIEACRTAQAGLTAALRPSSPQR